MDSLKRGRIQSPRPILAKEVRLVNRTEEMNALKEAVYRAVHGEGGLVLVHGEAGIGKTRLLKELGAYAESRGVHVLHGRCPALFRMDGVPPYVIWKEVIKDYLEVCTPEQLYRVIGYYPAEVAKLVPELSQKLRAIPQSFPISPEQEQNRLFEAVSQFITNISQENPLLVVLDDLQWTDPSSLLLLHYLARGVLKTPLLILGAYRSTDVDAKHPLTPVLTELNRERLPESILLKRMSLDDVSDMIKNILEQEDVPEEFCKLVYEKTKGNPFFAEEVVKFLKEEDVIFREGTVWKFKNVSKIEFPETVKNVLKTRYNRLDDECKNVLTMASIVGSDFTVEALSALTGIEENKLLELMDGMLKTGLVKEREVHGEAVCSFADILVRDVVYEEVSLLKRKKLHEVVGCTLEKVYAQKIDEHFGELAYHFLEGGDKDKALDYFLKAGEKAARIYANTEAASYYQSALKLIEEKEGELKKKGEVLERLGDIKSTLGEYDICINSWNQGLLLWEQLGEKEKVAKLHRKMSLILWRALGETEKAKEHQETALEVLEKESEGTELARLYADMSRLAWHTGSMDKARSLAEKALELSEKMQALEVIAEAYNNLAMVLGSTGEANRAVQCIEKALKIALDSSNMESTLRAYNNLAVALPAEEEDRSLELWEKGFELAKRVGHPHWISWMGRALAGMCLGMGNTTQALQLAEQSVSLDRKTHNLGNLSASLMSLGNIYRMLGDWDKSEQNFMEALEISKKLNRFQNVSNSYVYLGNFHLYAKEEPARAKEFFEKAFQICEKAGARSQKMLFSEGLIASCIRLGEIDKANSMLDDLQKYAFDVNDRSLISSAHVLRATHFRAQKRWEEAIEYFEKGLGEWEALNYRQRNVYNFAKLGFCEYARVYLERKGEGDKEKARDLLNQALEMFQKMGAKKDIEKVEAELIYIETGKVVSKPKPLELVPTGYADLDKLLHGGLRSNCAVVLTSPPCSETNLLIKSFLETGAEKGEVTFYVTIDPSAAKPLAEKFPSNSYLLVCNPEAGAIIKSSSNVFTLKGVENLTDISIALTSAIRRLDPSLKGSRRICIGLVSDVLLQHHAVETRRWLTALMTKLKSEAFTTLAVIDPQMHPSEELHAILGLFDGEISIYEKETDEGPRMYLKIKKMSNQEYQESGLPLKKEDLKKRE